MVFPENKFNIDLPVLHSPCITPMPSRMPSPAAAPAVPTQTRRNIRLLVAAQALGGASPPIIISLGGIVGQTLSPDASLATLPVSLYNLGLALSTIPVALLMRRVGRRAAYVSGAFMAMLGGVVATMGIASSSFLLFCIGTALAGFYGACVQSYRFAAADIVAPLERPKAISRIMLGGLIAAVIGPQVVIWTRDLWVTAPFAGSFLGQTGLALLALPVLLLLRIPPASQAMVEGVARPLGQIARSPQFIVAVLSGIVSYGLMAFIMTAAPMAMVGCGHTVGEAALGIQWHVLAMFAPSFFTGHLINRFGKIAVTAAGLMLIAGAGLMALAGQELLHFWGSLVLLGVGWNFGFVGATAMVTDTYTAPERAKVQALNDFLVFGTVAGASFGAGRLLSSGGWDQINMLMLPLIGLTLLLLAALAWRGRATTPRFQP